MSDTAEINIVIPEMSTDAPEAETVSAPETNGVEIPDTLAAPRPGPGRPRKAGVAVATGKAKAAKAPAKPAIAKGKPAVSSGTKRTAGKDVTVKGAAEGTTLTAAQQKQVDKITKLLAATQDLEVKRSGYMWDVSEAIATLLTPTDANAVPVKQKDLARHIGVDPTNISIWAKTWRFYGDTKNRVTVKGVEASFNDHVERARMLNDDGVPANQELYSAIEKAVEEEGTSFAVAKRSVRQGPSPSSLDIQGARDRVNQMAAKINELAGPNPSGQDVFVALSAMQDVSMVVGDVINRVTGAGGTFTEAAKQFMDGYEGMISQFVDKVRKG